jgi:hypothetical protein
VPVLSVCWSRGWGGSERHCAIAGTAPRQAPAAQDHRAPLRSGGRQAGWSRMVAKLASADCPWSEDTKRAHPPSRTCEVPVCNGHANPGWSSICLKYPGSLESAGSGMRHPRPMAKGRPASEGANGRRLFRGRPPLPQAWGNVAPGFRGRHKCVGWVSRCAAVRKDKHRARHLNCLRRTPRARRIGDITLRRRWRCPQKQTMTETRIMKERDAITPVSLSHSLPEARSHPNR